MFGNTPIGARPYSDIKFVYGKPVSVLSTILTSIKSRVIKSLIFSQASLVSIINNVLKMTNTQEVKDFYEDTFECLKNINTIRRVPDEDVIPLYVDYTLDKRKCKIKLFKKKINIKRQIYKKIIKISKK